jgi:hypothetical protein
MERIILKPQAASDPSAEDLQPLGEAISRETGAEVLVLAADPVDGRIAGVALWEVVNLWVTWDHVPDAVIGAIVTELIRWARRRFRDGNSRPKSGRILGPDGRVIRTVKLLTADGDFEDLTGSEQRTGILRLPPDVE